MANESSTAKNTDTAKINPADFAYQISQSRWHSFNYALAGFGYMFYWQKNVRIIAGMSILAGSLGFWLAISRIEWAILILTIALVWITEFVNASVEAAIDLAIGDTYHPMAQVGKDVAAASVLLASIFALIIGLLLFLEPLLDRVPAL